MNCFKVVALALLMLGSGVRLQGQDVQFPRYFLSSNLSYGSAFDEASLSLEFQRRFGKRFSIELAPEFYLLSLQNFRVAETESNFGIPSGLSVRGFYLFGSEKVIFAIGPDFRYAKFGFTDGTRVYAVEYVSGALLQEFRLVDPSGFMAEIGMRGGLAQFSPIGGGRWNGDLFVGLSLGMGYCF